MKKIAAASVLALVVGLLGLAPAPAGAADATVTIVHALTYDFPDATFPVSACVDGVDAGVLEVSDSVTVDAQSPQIDIRLFQTENPDCTDPGDYSIVVPLDPGDDVTVVAYWSEQGPALTSYDNDTGCVPAGYARINAFHGTSINGPTTVDVWAGIQGEDPIEVFSDFEAGDFASADVPVGMYDVSVYADGTTPPAAPIVGPVTLELTEGRSTTVFVAGGNDGDIGAFATERELEVCEEETTTTTTTTTTVPATTTTTQPAAQAVDAEADFTG